MDAAVAFLHAFVAESNRIEGIAGTTANEVSRTAEFLGLEQPTIGDLCALVRTYQPDAILRDKAGLNVRVGGYVAPPGGPGITHKLDDLLVRMIGSADPWKLHVDYETLHPFTDGNGRSGRGLWAWQMVRRPEGLSLGFLHRWYYQTLERVETRGK